LSDIILTLLTPSALSTPGNEMTDACAPKCLTQTLAFDTLHLNLAFSATNKKRTVLPEIKMLKRQQLIDLIFTASIFVILVRTLMIFIFPLLLENALSYNLVSDNVHHYHIGLVLILLGIGLYKKLQRHFLIYLAFCLALIIEEYLVIVYELGVRTPYIYLSFTDNLVVYSSAVCGVLLACGARKVSRV
jgi:hypothetical protein